MTQQTTAMQPAKEEGVQLKRVPFKKVFDRVNELHNSISRIAFELYERNGRKFGHDLEDWLRAESELLHSIHVAISESENALTVHAELPGFSANEVEVSLEPWRLSIAGKREAKEEYKSRKYIYSEQCMDQVMRVINLPVEVDTTKMKTTLKDGVLELEMPKAKKALAKTKAA
jgi:HSP20 family protein